MVGVDLSRAFDTLDRPCLLRTLEFAQVPQPLQRLLLEIHNQCKYTVTHGQCQGSFPLRCGVRQGCARSPMLFSLFTCWFLTELRQRTSEEWVTRFVTWFADDSHLGWEVHSPADLDFVCRSLRATFGLLKECGMCANPLKSTIVLGLKGSYAKRWIRAHTVYSNGRRCVQLGTPVDPLIIPVAHSFQYLGTVISFGAIELQTCRHRLQIARMQRTRLLRFLHSRQLTLPRRLTLYLACVRSTMLYGIHAVGINDRVLQTLEVADIKFLRGIARSPVHLTHESNVVLRRRLKVPGPTVALASLLRRRVGRSNDAEAVSAMRATLAALTHMQTPTQTYRGTITAVHVKHWFACPTCGQYFGTMRDLHTHQSKKHGHQPKPALLGAKDLMSHAVDGMPQCRHCSAMFTRVEALKKHLRGCCPVLFGTRPEPSTAETGACSPVAKGPTGSGEPKGASPPAPSPCIASTEMLAAATRPGSHTPLFDEPGFKAALQNGWRTVFAQPQYKQSLQTHCVFCGQWLTMTGPSVKQHVRLAHPEYWPCKADAVALCSEAGFVHSSPCHYCAHSYKAPRAHVKHCPALFQAALARQVLQNAGRGRATCSSPGGDLPCLGDGRPSHDPTCLEFHVDAEGGGAGGTAQCRSSTGLEAVQVAEAVGEGTPRQRQLVGLVVQGVGKGPASAELRSGPADHDPPQGSHEDGSPARRRTLPRQGRLQFHVVHRRGGRAQCPAGHAADSCQLAGSFHGGNCDNIVADRVVRRDDAAAPVTPPRLAAESGPDGSPHGSGLASTGSHGAQPGVAVLPVGCSHQVPGGIGPGPAHPRPGSALRRCAAQDGLQPVGALALQSGQGSGGGGGRGDSVSGFSVSSGAAGPGLLHRPDHALTQRRLEAFGFASAARKASQGPDGGGGRGGLSLHAVDGLEAASEPARRAIEENIFAPAGLAVVEAHVVTVACDAHRIPHAKLKNPHNICYINSCAQAFQWIGALAGQPRLCYGAAEAAIRLVSKPGNPFLPSCLPWVPLVRGWRHITRQHDAAEFMQHLLTRSAPSAYHGCWQSRLSNPLQVVDAGRLDSPLPLDLAGDDLQSLVDGWATQHAPHALVSHHGVLVLQLKRYHSDAAAPRKQRSMIHFAPGQTIAALMVLRGLVPVIRPSMWHIPSYIMETPPLRAIIKLCSVCLGVKDLKLTGNSVFAMTVLPRGLLPRLIYSPYRKIVTS